MSISDLPARSFNHLAFKMLLGMLCFQKHPTQDAPRINATNNCATFLDENEPKATIDATTPCKDQSTSFAMDDVYVRDSVVGTRSNALCRIPHL